MNRRRRYRRGLKPSRPRLRNSTAICALSRKASASRHFTPAEIRTTAYCGNKPQRAADPQGRRDVLRPSRKNQHGKRPRQILWPATLVGRRENSKIADHHDHNTNPNRNRKRPPSQAHPVLNRKRQECQPDNLPALSKDRSPRDGKSKNQLRLKPWQNRSVHQDAQQKHERTGGSHCRDDDQFCRIERPSRHRARKEALPLIFGMIESGYEGSFERNVEWHHQECPEDET